MNDILAKMYGLDPNKKLALAETRPKNTGTGYYGSSQHLADMANGVGPPPADQGGPNAMELAIHEGYADENGMLSNGMHSIVSAMYGGDIQKITAGQSLNPNYQAGSNGQTVGGIGDRDAWGRRVNWSNPQTDKLNEGQIHSTPAGDYKVEKNPWGQFVLVPQGSALRSGSGAYLTNITGGQHHLGINPNTGEVWYQKSEGGTNFSGGGKSYYGEPNGPSYSNNGGGNNGGSSAEDNQPELTFKERLQNVVNNINSLFNDPKIIEALGNNSDPKNPTSELNVTKGLFGDKL